MTLNDSIRPPKPSALDYLHFCGFVRELSESWSECFLFRPVSTPLGLCYSFNSLTFEEVYNSNEHSKAWKKVFDKGQDHASNSNQCTIHDKQFLFNFNSFFSSNYFDALLRSTQNFLHQVNFLWKLVSFVQLSLFVIILQSSQSFWSSAWKLQDHFRQILFFSNWGQSSQHGGEIWSNGRQVEKVSATPRDLGSKVFQKLFQ